MAIDWKTIISEFDGKPTLLQAIGKLRKAVEDETITIQQAQAEIAKLESQQKADEALINTKQDKLNDKSDVTVAWLTANGVITESVRAGDVSDDEDNIYNFPKKAGTFALTSDVAAVESKAQNALDLATTNETDIGTLDGQVAALETSLNNKQDKIGNQTELTARSLTTIKDIVCENNLKGRYLFCSNTNMGSPSNSPFLIFEYGQNGIVKSTMRFQTFANMGKEITINFPNDDGTVVYTKSLKTIFGNQSIVGTGNIDLYKHHINLNIAGKNLSGNLFIDIISSNSLKCDSLTDIQTLLGQYFTINCFGSVLKDATDVMVASLATETSIIVGLGYDILWSEITTITDTVTTI